MQAYRLIKRNYPGQTIPVCYSLQGALLDVHWDALPQRLKGALVAEAKG